MWVVFRSSSRRRSPTWSKSVASHFLARDDGARPGGQGGRCNPYAWRQVPHDRSRARRQLSGLSGLVVQSAAASEHIRTDGPRCRSAVA
jgi:hypothetical protein